MKTFPWYYLLIALLVFSGIFIFQARNKARKTSQVPTESSPVTPTATTTVTPSPIPSPSESSTKTIKTSDLVNVSAQYRYTAKIPANWEVEIIKETEAINFYDPTTPGATNLEKSQLFVRYFSANNFLTLSSVNILDRKELSIQGRPAVRYTIEKKPSAANFPNQPSWRNQKHVVTDIRVSDSSPSIFYVVAKRPELDETVYDRILSSVRPE